jgi:ferredoxin-NADP reductase
MRNYLYFIHKIYLPAPDVLMLEIGDIRGLPVFDFKPGQYVMIYFKNAQGRLEQKHSFSIASSPLEKRFIRLGLKIGGKFTQGLSKLAEGAEIFVQGPYGGFVFNEHEHSDLVMIAGGIGVTPFMSALNYAADKHLTNQLSIIYSCRTLESAVFFQDITELKQRHKNIRSLVSITNEKILPAADGIISGRIDAEALHKFVGQVQGKTFFICGPALFMQAMTDNLIKLGVRASQIQKEEFSMTGSGLRPTMLNLAYATSFSAAIFLLAMYLINNSAPTNALSANQSYNPALLASINKTALERLNSITNAKNKAIADLNKRQQALISALASSTTAQNKAQSNSIKQTTTVKTPNSSQPAASVPTAPAQSPSSAITPVQPSQQPAQNTAPAPTPRTRVS